MFEGFVALVRELFSTDDFVPLHEPRFRGKEKTYLEQAIDSTYVSSVGPFVDRFEKEFADYVGTKHAVSVVNGTAALHVSLLVSGVKAGDEVITQPLSFVATCNAISYCGAHPVFVDVERETLGLSPDKLSDWLANNTEDVGGERFNKTTNRRVAACVPMHTFGFVGELEQLRDVCSAYNIVLVEDAAEAVGSFRDGVHSGNHGSVAAFSFNGNKIITTGGGGMVVTNDDDIALRAKHITTTAKVPHAWEYEHDQIAFNYRMPNLNAALGCAQLEQIGDYLQRKQSLHKRYATGCSEAGLHLIDPPAGAQANYWLNAVLLDDKQQRDDFLAYTNSQGIMTRPVWRLLHTLPMYQDSQTGPLPNAQWLAERIVNIPSSVPVAAL